MQRVHKQYADCQSKPTKPSCKDSVSLLLHLENLHLAGEPFVVRSDAYSRAGVMECKFIIDFHSTYNQRKFIIKKCWESNMKHRNEAHYLYINSSNLLVIVFSQKYARKKDND